MLRSIVFLSCFYPYTALCSLIGLLCSLRGAAALHTFSRHWGRGCLRLAGIRLTVTGEEHLPHAQPVIYMANHQSNFDIPTLFSGLPGQFRWMAKAELFRVPLFGLVLQRAGYIPVERDDRRKAVQSMNAAVARIVGGTSVVIFPEGTRSPDGQLLPLKKGGFVLAQLAGVPIVPVAISGTGAIMRKGSLRLHHGNITLRIFPPLTVTGKGAAEREQVMEQVRLALASAMPEVQ